MRNLRHHCAVLGAAALLAACASAHRGASGAEPKAIALIVTNQNWLDVDVFLIRGTSRHRLGAVGGNSSATLSIPAGLFVYGDAQLMADPIGSDDIYVTERISVAPDATVELTIAPRMRMSSYAVWNP
jgi:hypothetical protein